MDQTAIMDQAAINSGEFATASTPDLDPDADRGIEFDDVDNAPAWSDRSRGSHRGESARLLGTLRHREAELNAYAERLRERQLSLDAVTQRVEERIVELERSKEEFAALVASVDQAAERDIEHLVEMYSKMKPKAAGALFNTMAPTFAAGFLGRMRADKASAILAKMDADKAYAVSLELAGRNVQLETAAPSQASSAGRSE